MILAGSPKQIAWGKKIRTERLCRWRKSDPEIFVKVESLLNEETSAAWWITHREKELEEVLPFIGTGPVKTSIKPKVSSPVSSSLPDYKKDYAACTDGIHRYVGELRDMVTGEIVVDPECPF